MTGPRRIAVALALVAWLAPGCGGEPAPPTPSVRVLLIGDSITAGMVSAPTGPPYATLLGELLGPHFELVNLGCGGTSSLDWTRSRGAVLCGGEYAVPNLYDKLVKSALPADLVTVLLGTNDALGIRESQRVPVEDYEAALRELCSNLLADGAARVMLLGPPFVVHSVPAMMRIMQYGDALRRVCDEMDRVICGPDVRFLLDAKDFANGNIHPNANGHRKIAEALAEAIRALYAEPREESSEDASASSSPGSSQSASAPAPASSSRLP